MNLLQLVRRMVTQQTNSIGAAVENIHGGAPKVFTTPAVLTDSTWGYAEVPDIPTVSLDDFYAVAATQSRVTVQQLATIDGVLDVPDGDRRVFLLTASFTTASASILPITFDAGEDTLTQFAIYKDGVLERRGQTVLSLPLAVDAGTHSLAIVCYGRRATLTVPAGVTFTVSEPEPVVPAWSSLTTSYLDPVAGTVQNILGWYVDPKVGGWNVFRRNRRLLGPITAANAQGSSTEFVVTLTGLWTQELSLGAQVFAGTLFLGTAKEWSTDGTTTMITVRPNYGGGVLKTTGAPQDWIGQGAVVGTFTQVGSLPRTTSTGIATWTDTQVSAQVSYEYALQAYGMFDPQAVSAYSELRAVVSGDLTPPGPVTNLALTVLNKRALAKFHTPGNSDYAGVRVYYRSKITGTVTSATGSTFTDTAADFSAVDPTWTVRVAHSNGTVDEQPAGVVAGHTINVTGWLQTPSVGEAYSVYKDVLVLTDYGLPNSDDQFTFEPSLGFGDYHFRTFDVGNNEQAPEGGRVWTYSAASDTYTGPNQPPVVSIEQLNNATQAGWSAPYNNLKDYVIVRIGASDPVDGVTGVTLFYILKGQSTSSMAASTAATLNVIDPGGTGSSGRSRYLALERSTEQNWIQVWAVDQAGLTSGISTYAVDYNDSPDFAAVETRVDTGANAVYVSVVADDDAMSGKWWLVPAAGTTLAAGEPTVGAPASFGDLSTTKTVTVTFALNDGERKTLVLVPYSGTPSNGFGNAGGQVTRDFARAPRTTVVFESKDANGSMSGLVVKAGIKVVPDVANAKYYAITSATAQATGNTGTTLGLVSPPAMTADQYAWSPGLQKFYFLEVLSGTGAGQVRRVVSNTTGGLFTVSPAWATVPNGATMRLHAAGTLVKVDGDVEALPTYTPRYFNRQGDKSITVEYYSVVTGLPAEDVKRTSLDQDTVAYIDTLQVIEPTSGPNTLQVTVAGLDDDVKYWRAYIRKGSWPTLTGSAPVQQTNGRWNVDETYLAFIETANTLQRTRSASSGVWYVVVVPENGYGEDGTARTAQCDVVGAASPALSLSAPVPQDNGSAAYNKLAWAHNAAISATGTNRVRIYAYRQDQGAGTEVELTTGTTRDAMFDVGADWSNSNDTNTVASAGSYLHNLSATRGTAGNGSFYTWKYRVLLYDWAGTTLRATYTTEHSDYYLGAATSVTGVSASLYSPGSAGVTFPVTCISPLVTLVTWTTANTNDTDYSIFVDFARTSGAPTSSDWYPLYQGLTPSAGSVQHSQDGIYQSGASNNYSIWYRVYAVSKTSGAVSGSQLSVQYITSVQQCAVS
jgi:hypothetical protein